MIVTGIFLLLIAFVNNIHSSQDRSELVIFTVGGLFLAAGGFYAVSTVGKKRRFYCCFLNLKDS